jgi:hypothetical protein
MSTALAMSPETRELQRKWYRRLRASGFRDVEVLKRYPTGRLISIAGDGRAETWGRVTNAAADLPMNWRGRALIRDIAEVGCMTGEVLARSGLTRKAARIVWARFCRRAGLRPVGVLCEGGRHRPRWGRRRAA